MYPSLEDAFKMIIENPFKGFEIGQLATELLPERIENDSDNQLKPRIMYLDADLIVKNST